MKHGGDILSYQHLYDGQIIDFSSNINPLGYPKILDTIIPEVLGSLTAYPDIHYRVLRTAISEYLGCQPDEVLVGNGSMEILEHFCREAQRIVVCIPCFIEYIERAQIYRKKVKKIRLPDGFRCSTALFGNELQRGDVVILGNPNNPTGLRIAEDELLELQQLAEEQQAFLLLDEAFFEFCVEDYDSVRLLHGKENICVIRAATKFFGLPGIRLGYAYATQAIAEQYAASALPWRINAIADAAGRAIFRETAYIECSKALIREQRHEMFSELQKIDSIKVFPTHTNFILIKLLYTTEDELFQQLLRHGLLIRKASSFEGVDRSYIRLAVKDQKSNRKLIETLNRCV
ncbi:aspartate aminotransferase [candidate division KSB3 bacterium]|uniref:Aspartate aminotransferase n=1 Tax=candidate division KSB3 bacterium TaxID=2044937 RepID=A0A2G6KHF1_9BACT|nr:MAG: aspartate aminotransferase [candidate division KSB3 bacterium]